MMNVFFNDLSDLLWNTWPEIRAYHYELKPETKKNNEAKTSTEKVDPRLEWFKEQDYDTMDKSIKDIESLLEKMKAARKNRLDSEIKATEDKLSRLRSVE